MSNRIAKRVLLLGWDAADWKVITPLLDAGQMPALASLIERGCMGNISTLNPPLSPILWTSINTGKWAFKHGIRGFLEPADVEPGMRPVSSTSRTCKALWNICHQAGLNTHAIGHWASHPAEPIRGVCISDEFLSGAPAQPEDAWPLRSESVHPERWSAWVEEMRVHPGEISDEDLRTFIPRLGEVDRASDKRPRQLAEALAKAASIQAILLSIIRREPWDFISVYFDTIDVVSHHFMPFHPPQMDDVTEADFEIYQNVVRQIYLFHDLMLQNILVRLDQDTAIVLLSDHGFHCDHLRPRNQKTDSGEESQISAAPDALWHRPLGVLCMAGPGLKRDERIYGASLLDIAPTVLTLLGLPVGQDMDGKVLGTAFEVPVDVERIESWDSLEGDAGQHPPDKRHQPFDHAAVIRHLVDLGYIEAPRDDIKKNSDLAIREGNFNLAISYMEAQRPDEARKLLEPIYQAYPDRPRFGVSLAQALFQSGRVTESAQLLKQVIAQNGSSPDRDLFLGIVQFNLGQKQEAAELVACVATRQPHNPQVLVTLGNMLVDLQRFDEAVKALERAVALDESNARAHDHLAFVYLKQGRYEEAAQSALNAVGLVHSLFNAHLHLGMALCHMEEYKRAIGPLEWAAHLNPGLVDAHRYLATAHRALGNWDLVSKHRDLADHLLRTSSQSVS